MMKSGIFFAAGLLLGAAALKVMLPTTRAVSWLVCCWLSCLSSFVECSKRFAAPRARELLGRMIRDLGMLCMAAVHLSPDLLALCQDTLLQQKHTHKKNRLQAFASLLK
jgi:hypothetical protein